MMMDLSLVLHISWLFWSNMNNTKLCTGIRQQNIILHKLKRSQKQKQLILLIIQQNSLRILIFRNSFWLKRYKIWMKNILSSTIILFQLKFCSKAKLNKAKTGPKVHLREVKHNDNIQYQSISESESHIYAFNFCP